MLPRLPQLRGHFRFPGQFPSSPAIRRVGLGLALGLAILAIVAVVLGHETFPMIAPFVASILILAAIADLATALVLVTMWHPWQPERSIVALAFGYVVIGVLTLITALVLPLWPGGPAPFPANAQAAAWLYCFAHAAIAAAALVYACLRGSAVPTTRRFVVASGAIVLAVLAASLIAAVGFGDRLPHIVVNGSIAGLRTTGAGPIVSLLCAFAALRMLRVRPSAEIDQAVAFAMAALTLETLVNTINGARYTGAWYVSRMLMCAGATSVLVAAIRTLVRSSAALVDTRRALARSEIESQQSTQRIRALWGITSSDTVSEDVWVRSIIESAASTIRPQQTMCGMLCHAQDEMVIVDEIAWTGPAHDATHPSVLGPGASFPIERTHLLGIAETGRTHAWPDLAATGRDDTICYHFGWRSLIATAVVVGRQTYFLVFGSPDPMLTEPIADDDVAYIDVVAAFVAHRFSERHQRERIQYQIEHDALTGLENRTQFRSALRRAIASRRPFALAFVDLDDFASVNELAGNMIADELLVEIAVGLDGIDPGDFVARIGGDDFAVILPGVATAEDATARLRPYADLFRDPFHTGDRDGKRMMRVFASIGAAIFPADATTMEELTRSADTALATAKERGGGATLLFDRAMRGRLESAYVKSVELADAIDNGGLELVYQPTFDLATASMRGAEALVRWNHPMRGQLLPAEFIDFAERNRLMGRLTRWVMHRAIADLASLPALPPGFRVYFNLATSQLDDLEIIAELEARLFAAPRIADHLGVEITETAAINNTEASMYALDRFHKLGMRIAIDDFGTGYSSLSYLKRLPVDMIKIDRTFITGLPSDEKDAALCELLLQIANRFGLTALAEGIETEEQRVWLHEHGCGFGQGYLVSRPLAFSELALLVRAATATIA